jgi:hypothetical protein
MSKWFPRADGPRVSKALAAGVVGALLVALVSALALAILISKYPSLDTYTGNPFILGWLFGGICRVLMALFAAWRFAIGKGLVWGSVVLLLFLLPLFGYFYMGTASANLGWIFVRIPAGAAMIAGIYGAWAARTIEPAADYAEVFE